MSTDNALTVTSSRLAIMPVMDNQTAMMRRQAVIDFTKTVMIKDTDYGRVPGTNKDTLLKPGAEKLTSLFGLSPRFSIVEKETDWTGKDHNGEPFFYFQYRCSLYYGDILAGEGVGSCNAWEKKYRYRKGERLCPNCGQAAIIKGKADYGGGWICFAKKGGCGAKFGDHDPAIVGQEVGQVLNDNPADVVNTIDKMAQKRSLVAAVLIAVNASEFFTQDIEDMDFGQSDVIDITPPPVQRPAKTAPVNRQPAPLPPVKAVPNGLNPETGEVLPPRLSNTELNQANAAGVGWEELNRTPAQVDQGKWQLFRGKVQASTRNTVGSVCSAAAATGAYQSGSYALNVAQKLHPDLEKAHVLIQIEALQLYDDLIAYKQADQAPLFPDDKRPVDEKGIPYSTDAEGNRHYHGDNAKEALQNSLLELDRKHDYH